MHYSEIKKRVRIILDNPDKNDHVALTVHIVIAVAILINALAIILYTVSELALQYSGILNLIINTCLLLFAVEYFLRIWSCTDTKNPVCMVTDRLKYGTSFFLIIDLISIIPIFIPFLFPTHLALIRLLRLISIFKLGRFTRYTGSLGLLHRVIKRKSEIFVIMMFFLVFIILFSSTIMYFVEFPAQPDKFSSIPAALWWAVMTVTTVGYGDIYPITPLGKFIGAVVTIIGVLILALPSAILATGFMEERERLRSGSRRILTPDAKIALIAKLKDLKNREIITTEDYEMLISEILDDQKSE